MIKDILVSLLDKYPNETWDEILLHFPQSQQKEIIELLDANDTLLTNGMLDRYEKQLVATRHTKQECNQYLSRMKHQAPDTEYIIEGTKGCYFISQIWYIPVSGSDVECNAYDRDDIRECAQALGVRVVS